MPGVNRTWIDRTVGFFSPRLELQRIRFRVARDLLVRHYEGAGSGRRTQGWRKTSGDANTTIGPALTRLRENARDLVRNNPYAESALATIADHTVGWGIVGKPVDKGQLKAADAWRRWAESTDCDADGRHDFAGLQKLVMRTVVESGECLVRRRLRRPEDGLAVPLQLQVLDPDFLDNSKDSLGISQTGGPRTIQGVQIDAIGRRTGYWLFPEHPGSSFATMQSSFVPAESVQHIFKASRPGQVRAPSWFAPVLLMMRDFDEFADATLMKAKIAACLTVLTTDPSGANTPLGTVDPLKPTIDAIEPGAIIPVAPGSDISIVNPPSTNDYDAYARNVLRGIATGLGVTYEDMTGDYQQMPFSAARMSRLRHESRVHDWRWRLIIPQFCDPAWAWFMEVAVVMGLARTAPLAKWTPPPLPMVNPETEGLAEQRMIRTGLKSLPEAMRERGYDPDELMQEIADSNKKLDDLGIVLDSDPRKITQAGQAQSSKSAGGEQTSAADPQPAAAKTARFAAMVGGRA